MITIQVGFGVSAFKPSSTPNSVCSSKEDVASSKIKRGALRTKARAMAIPYWNRGYGTEALGAVIDYMFDRVGLNRLEAYHAVGNPASGRIMEKCGMKKDGICREKYRTADGLADCAHYAILAKDVRPRRTNPRDKA